MSTIHLVYPCGNSISTPDAIGRNVANHLKKDHDVKIYNWTSTKYITPGDNDIIIGHAHPNPLTIFRRSIKNSRWKQRILLQPFTTYLPHIAYLGGVINHIDNFAAITGKYWMKQLQSSDLSSWSKKIIQFELAVDRNDFPLLKRNYNSESHRRILYIGNSDPCKNIKYLKQISQELGQNRFSAIGTNIQGFRNYGRIDFSSDDAKQIVAEHDFLIVTSISDANPTVVLEAMSWGLIPIITPQCGYLSSDGPILIPQNDVKNATIIIRRLMELDSENLTAIQLENCKKLDDEFNWINFNKRVDEILSNPTIAQQQIVKNPNNLILEEIRSDKFFARPSNLLNFLKMVLKDIHE